MTSNSRWQQKKWRQKATYQLKRSLVLNIGASSLRRWINEYDENGESAFPGHGKALFNATYEIKKLQKENVALREENEILKKLQAFLKQKNA